MSYVIKAALSNAQHPEYGQITIPFPIPSDQYDQTIEKLQAIELGFSVNRDCTVDGIDSWYSVLGALKDTIVNVDQLDYLAKRLDSFCDSEDAQFQAMDHKLEITPKQGLAEGKNPEYLYLPAAEHQIERTLFLSVSWQRIWISLTLFPESKLRKNTADT